MAAGKRNEGETFEDYRARLRTIEKTQRKRNKGFVDTVSALGHKLAKAK